MIKNFKIGLALSGGGYRAAAFHLGTLKKLHELGILDKIDVLSTVSGGSIVGAYYLLNKSSFQYFQDNFSKKLQCSVIKKIILSPKFLLFTLILISIFLLLIYFVLAGILNIWLMLLVLLVIVSAVIIFLHNIIPITELKVKAYRSLFFGDNRLNNFPVAPEIVINSMNLETGTLFTFSQAKMGDSTYSYLPDDKGPVNFKHQNFPIALAVASSTAVPFPFNPINIGKQYFANSDDIERAKPSLMDGGIYDNQGIYKLIQSKSSHNCEIVICSDGSSPIKKSFREMNPLPILNRAVALMMRRIKNMQFIHGVYEKADDKVKEIAYFSLDWQYERCIEGFINALRDGAISDEIISSHRIPANLLDFNNQENILRLQDHIKERIGFSDILQNGASTSEIERLSCIGTNLTALKLADINSLVKHAVTLTEIQIKLYCPSLLN